MDGTDGSSNERQKEEMPLVLRGEMMYRNVQDEEREREGEAFDFCSEPQVSASPEKETVPKKKYIYRLVTHITRLTRSPPCL